MRVEQVRNVRDLFFITIVEILRVAFSGIFPSLLAMPRRFDRSDQLILELVTKTESPWNPAPDANS